MKVLYSALVAGALAETCNPSWYYQQGQTYNYEVSTTNNIRFADKGINSNDLTAYERTDGTLSIDVQKNCEAIASFIHVKGRRRETNTARVRFGNGNIQSIAFPSEQTTVDNNGLKAIFSSLQFDQTGVVNHPTTVSELTNNGFSDSEYSCECGCEDVLAIEKCTCSDDCPITVTRKPTMIMNVDENDNLFLESIAGKMSMDVNMGEISCKYNAKNGVPSLVSCVQQIWGSEINSVESSIDLILDSVTSSTGKSSTTFGADEDLKINSEESISDVCVGDISCLTKLLMSVSSSDSEAVQSKYLLGKSIQGLLEEQILALIQSVGQNGSVNTVTYLFTELAQCHTSACEIGLVNILDAGLIEVYPTVFRAVQLQDTPSERLVSLMSMDAAKSSSVEKLSIILDAVKRVDLHAKSHAEILNMISILIGSECATSAEDFTLMGYFTETATTTDYEMVLALKIAQEIDAQSLIGTVSNCLIYKGRSTVVENAILTMAKYLSPEDLVQSIPATSPQIAAALMVGISENNHIGTEQMYTLFSNVYGSMEGETAFIRQMLLALDNTDTKKTEETRFEKTIRLVLPAFVEEIQMFSGLSLSVNVFTTGSAITIRNELVNGENLRLVQGDLVINSFMDMMNYSTSGFQACPIELWEKVLAAENSMTALAEAMINMNFEAILQTDAISHLKSFLQLGGVQFKVLDEKIAAGWLINMIDNIAEFIKSDASYTPSVSEVYTIFTKGFSTKYFNTFERKQQMTIGLVSGMRMTTISSKIMTIDYNGNILPHLSSLGATGDIALIPSISAGQVVETEFRSCSMTRSAISISNGHISFNGKLAYAKSNGSFKLKFVASPSNSPVSMHNWQYMNNEFDVKRHMETKIVPVLASNLVVKTCPHGWEIMLDQPIEIEMALKYLEQYGLLLSVGNLGSAKLVASGTPTSGQISVAVNHFNNSIVNIIVKTHCSGWEDCQIKSDIKLPNQPAITHISGARIGNGKIMVKSTTNRGSENLAQFVGALTEEKISITGSSSFIGSTNLQCAQTITSSNSPSLSCDGKFNDYFISFEIGHSGRVSSVNIKSSVFALSGKLNRNKEFRLSYFQYPSSLFTDVSQMDNKVLGNHEILDIKLGWPVLKNSARKIISSIEYQTKSMMRAFMLYRSAEKQQAQLMIPLLDLKLTYDVEIDQSAPAVVYNHAFQMNPRKLQRVIGSKIRMADLDLITDNRDLIVHRFDVEYPSNNRCSKQVATATNSVVTRFQLGQNTMCLSGSQIHFALNTNAKNLHFDFFSGYNLEKQAAKISLVNDNISGAVIGQWNINLEGESRSVAMKSTVEVSGKLFPEAINGAVQIQGDINNDQLNAVMIVQYLEKEVKFEVTGDFTKTTINGFATQAIILKMPENDLSLKNVQIFTKNGLPTGFRIYQSSFLGEYIIDTESSMVYMNLENTDEIVPLTKSTFSVDSTGISAILINTDPAVRYNFDYKYSGALTCELLTPLLNLKVTPAAESHTIVVDAADVGLFTADVFNYYPYVQLVNLGVNLQTSNFEIAEDISTSGKIRIVADASGLKTDGLKIHHIFNMYGYAVKVDSEILTNNAVEGSHDVRYKWCKPDAELSYGSVEVSRKNRSLGSVGTYFSGGNTKCTNSIAVYAGQYHMVAATFDENTIKAMKIEVPTTYKQTSPIVLEADISSATAKITSALGAITTAVEAGQINSQIQGVNTDAMIQVKYSSDISKVNLILDGTINNINVDGSFASLEVEQSDIVTSVVVNNNGQPIGQLDFKLADGKTLILKISEESNKLEVDINGEMDTINKLHLTASAGIMGKTGFIAFSENGKNIDFKVNFNNISLVSLAAAADTQLKIDLTSVSIPMTTNLILQNGLGKFESVISSWSHQITIKTDEGTFPVEIQTSAQLENYFVVKHMIIANLNNFMMRHEMEMECSTYGTIKHTFLTKNLESLVNKFSGFGITFDHESEWKILEAPRMIKSLTAYKSESLTLNHLVNYEEESITYIMKLTADVASKSAFYGASIESISLNVHVKETDIVMSWNGFGVEINHETSFRLSPFGLKSVGSVIIGQNTFLLTITGEKETFDLVLTTPIYNGKVRFVNGYDMVVIYEQDCETSPCKASVEINRSDKSGKLNLQIAENKASGSLTIVPFNFNLVTESTEIGNMAITVTGNGFDIQVPTIKSTVSISPFKFELNGKTASDEKSVDFVATNNGYSLNLSIGSANAAVSSMTIEPIRFDFDGRYGAYLANAKVNNNGYTLNAKGKNMDLVVITFGSAMTLEPTVFNLDVSVGESALKLGANNNGYNFRAIANDDQAEVVSTMDISALELSVLVALEQNKFDFNTNRNGYNLKMTSPAYNGGVLSTLTISPLNFNIEGSVNENTLNLEFNNNGYMTKIGVPSIELVAMSSMTVSPIYFNIEGSLESTKAQILVDKSSEKIFFVIENIGSVTLNKEGSDVSVNVDFVNFGRYMTLIDISTYIIKSQGTQYTVMLSPMDIYKSGLYLTAIVTGESVDYRINDLISLKSTIVTIEINPTLFNVMVSEQTRLTLSREQELLNLIAFMNGEGVRSTYNMQTTELLIESELMEIRSMIKFVFDKLTADIEIVTPISTYVTKMVDGKIYISIPDIAMINLEVNGKVMTGTVELIDMLSLKLNSLTFEPITIMENFEIYVISDADLNMMINEFVVDAVTKKIPRGYEYSLQSELGAGMIVSLDGNTAVKVTEIFNPITWAIEHKLIFNLGNSYVTQSFESGLTLDNGVMNGMLNLKTILASADMTVSTNGLELTSLTARNIAINTKIGETPVFVNSGVSYVKNIAFNLAQTVVKLGDSTAFLVGGGADIPISFDLTNKVALVPNANLVLKITTIRVEISHDGLSNISISAAPYFLIKRNNGNGILKINASGYSLASEGTLTDKVFSQSIKFSQENSIIFVGSHTVASKKLMIDWNIVGNKLNLVRNEDNLEINVDSEELKIQSVMNKASRIGTVKLATKIILFDMKIDTKSFIMLKIKEQEVLSAKMNSVEDMSVDIKTPWATSKGIVKGDKIKTMTEISSVKLMTLCANYCKQSTVKLYNAGKQVGLAKVLLNDANIDLTVTDGIRNIEITVNRDSRIGSIKISQGKMTLSGVASSTGPISLEFSMGEIRFNINSETAEFVYPALNFYTQLIAGESFVFKVAPNQANSVDLLVAKSGNGHFKLIITDILAIESQMKNYAIRTQARILDHDISSIVSRKESSLEIHGPKVAISGWAKNGSFNLTSTSPLRSQIDYSDESMRITTDTRIYTLATNESGLVTITPSMRM